ncbi:amidase [Paenibacillus algicola]|uniref:Amidase n=1 Tax=Paenibacillus algicola TaxID=2565926 RepID=A0A4P8XSP2_9BACL|nr:amidase family protein [Paenibacillus algicola]QCT03689.1 amidase [Paenibacillus algicola]
MFNIQNTSVSEKKQSAKDPLDPRRRKRSKSKKSAFAATLALSMVFAGVVPFNSVNALTKVTSTSGTEWEVHDSYAPNLDTGSIRRAVNTPIQGFGNIFVQVSTSPEPRMNGQMMRGFGLVYDGEDEFATTQAVNLGDVHITRDIYFNSANNRVRYFDTFTNTTSSPVTVDVSFGGSLGYGTGNYQGVVKMTSSGDASIESDDAWALIANSRSSDRPIGVVLGSAAPFAGALQGTGNQQQDPFTVPLATYGNDSNFYGFIHSLTIEPGETQSLARFVVAGETGTDGLTQAADSLNQLVMNPDLTELTAEEVCTISNWDLSSLDQFDASACAAPTRLNIPAAPASAPLVTTSNYDVFNKSIVQMQRDMELGVTTSEAITRAYLDRIAAYDMGQLGFHSFLHVSETAIQQAIEADQARRGGQRGGLLGIPIAIKDIYDTKDMPTTGGSRALEGWQPSSDAYQVQKLREAGAVIIGKTNTSEFANSGSFSESGWMQTWNALYPSKTSFGSSGGSAVAVGAGFAAAAMGTQTGVSLYAPTVGASLTTFRGTDGMASVSGVMPLTWGQDYAGPMARTVTDLAYLLNATTGTDPSDILTVEADAKRPADWTAALNTNALQGKRIGYIPSSFNSSFADDGTGQAIIDQFKHLEDAGAIMVEMATPPGGGEKTEGNPGAEGWARYLEPHANFPYASANELLASEKVLLYNQRANQNRTRMSEEEVQKYIDYRTNYKNIIAGWMDEYEVDSVVYAGFISDMYNNDAQAAQLSSDRGTGVLTSSVGLPTVVVPVGTSPNGYSISMQLVGKAWDDANVLAMGYALEQQSMAQSVTTFAPALSYVPPTTTPGNGGDETPTTPPGNGSGGDAPTTPAPTTPPVNGGGTETPTTPELPGGEPEVPVTPTPELKTFADTQGHWANSSIQFLIQRGLISGYPDETFRPNLSITRAEALKVLVMELGLNQQGGSFKDVPSTHWAAGYIGAAQQAGLMTGYTDGKFRPNDQLNRAEMAALVVRAFQLGGNSSTSFPDVQADSWSAGYIHALSANNIVTGYTDGTFRPTKAITRAEFATMVTRVLQR